MTTTTAATGAAVEFVGISKVESADGTRLTVRTDPYPVDAAGPCHVVEVVPRATETENEVMVYIDLPSAPKRPWDACTLDTRSVTIETREPVGSRTVRDGFGSMFFFRDGEWRGCDHVVVTCVTEPASCDGFSLRDSISNADVPRHFGMSNKRCAEPFAVVDVDYGAGACPLSDGGANPCAGKQVYRQFWEIVDEAWVLRATSVASGCGDIVAVVPRFDTELCSDLPAIRS